MPSFPDRVVLGRTGLQAGPLGVSGGYGVDKASLLKAFDRGVNYFYHGSRRVSGMTAAVRELVSAGHRHELVIVLQSYARWPAFMERTFKSGLKLLGIDHADVLLLGWYNHAPSEGIFETALKMRKSGLFKHLAISSHHRPSFTDYARDDRIGALHIRYNAAHSGAEKDVFPHLSKENRPGVVAYTATRWGQLMKQKKMPKGETPLRARDCYRFVLSNPDFQVCMTGPKNREQMDEALCALDEGPLSTEEMARIRRIGEYVHEHSGPFPW
jgi:aryl-alcohol dehydrogenase-like predicted oxidoreductase